VADTSNLGAKARFEHFLRSMIGGRHDEAEELLSPNVVWHLPPFADQPPFEGRAAVSKFMRQTPALFYVPESMEIDLEAVTWDDPFASCLATLTATTKHGAPYENRYVFFARIEEGLLAEVWEMMDTVRFQEQTRPPR
jgi:ketosteroid isomerase-like protein